MPTAGLTQDQINQTLPGPVIPFPLRSNAHPGAKSPWFTPWKCLDIESKNIQVVAQLVTELDSD